MNENSLTTLTIHDHHIEIAQIKLTNKRVVPLVALDTLLTR